MQGAFKRWPGCLRAVLTSVVLAGMTLPTMAQETATPPEGGAPLRFRPLAVVGEHVDGTAFKIPQGLHYDASHDEIFVADTGNRLIGIFDGGGVPKFMFAPGGGSHPLAIDTDGEGNIYVLSPGARQISVFDYRGEPIREIQIGRVKNLMPAVSGMALGPDGNLYVLDGGNGRILVFGADGSMLRVIRGAGKGGSRLQAPYDIAFDADGNLFVSDRLGTPVQVYDPGGSYLRGWGKRAIGASDFSTPSGISVDPEGRVYVADPLRQDVKVFDLEGNFLTRLGGFGNRPGEVAYPTDVVAGRSGRLYVVERVGRRFQVFEVISRKRASDHTSTRGRNSRSGVSSD